MNKLLITTLLLVLGAMSSFGFSENQHDDGELVPMYKQNPLPYEQEERKMDFSYIEATWYAMDEILEVSLFDIGYATIYIVDSNNNIVGATSTDTDVPVTLEFDIQNTDATYYIYVYSNKWYAEGSFVQ